MSQIIHKDLSYAIRGVLLDVHKQLGPMLPEKVYQEAIAVGLETKGVKCRVEKPFEVFYREQRVGLYYVDFWIEDGKVILELKVAPQILPLHQAQALSYLKMTGADLAIVANFGAYSLQDERLPNFLREKKPNFVWEKRPLLKDLPYPDLTSRLLEVCHRVYFELGPGFFHQIYRRATMVELHRQDLKYEYIKKMAITYQGHNLGSQDVRLILVEDKILLATVAVKQVDEVMKSQLKVRLKHLGYQVGLLVNFHNMSVESLFVRA